jgi:predicted PurR-regulated permease PerM
MQSPRRVADLSRTMFSLILICALIFGCFWVLHPFLPIVVTALVQSIVGGLGLLIAGVPFVAVLISLMMMLCIAQLGPALVLLPAVIWVFAQGDTWQGVVLSVISLVAVTLDNVLRPMLIRRGADLPLLLILSGVIGGLLSLGLVGPFIGPVILAITYTLLLAFVDDRIPAAAEALATEQE